MYMYSYSIIIVVFVRSICGHCDVGSHCMWPLKGQIFIRVCVCVCVSGGWVQLSQFTLCSL